MKKFAIKIAIATVLLAFAQGCGCCTPENICTTQNNAPSVCTNSQCSSSFGNETYVWENWQVGTNKIDISH